MAPWAKVVESKEQGTAAFKLGQHEQALAFYETALFHVGTSPVLSNTKKAGELELLAVIHSNAAECCLKLGRWQAAYDWSESALQFIPTHPKSLVRRQRAELCWRLEDSAPSGCGSGPEIQRAVVTLSQLLLPNLYEASTRMQGLYCLGPLGRGDKLADDKNVDIMFQMTPSLYEAIRSTVVEEIDSWLRLTQHLISLALRGR